MSSQYLLYYIEVKNYEILEAYLPNLDLLATTIAFNSGPGKSVIFNALYDSNPENMLSYVSTTAISYLCLLGLTYLVARRVKKTKSLLQGWSIGFIMLIFNLFSS